MPGCDTVGASVRQGGLRFAIAYQVIRHAHAGKIMAIVAATSRHNRSERSIAPCKRLISLEAAEISAYTSTSMTRYRYLGQPQKESSEIIVQRNTAESSFAE